MVGRTQALGWRCTQAGGDGPSRRRVAAAADGACGRRSAQVFETVVINYCLYAGAAVGFYQGDTLKILDDLTTLRPTVFVSVPRLYTRFYDKIVGGAKAKGGIAAALFGKALSAKLEVLHATGQTSHALWDTLVFKKVQKTLGLDRCSNAHTDRRPSTRARTALCARARLSRARAGHSRLARRAWPAARSTHAAASRRLPPRLSTPHREYGVRIGADRRQREGLSSCRSRRQVRRGLRALGDGRRRIHLPPRGRDQSPRRQCAAARHPPRSSSA
jgi:hypothetical protein